jgi:aminopeptidase N
MRMRSSWYPLLLAALAARAGAAAADVPQGRLPAGVTPTHYRLELRIDPQSETFSGETIIEVTLKQPSSIIWLHGLGLKVTSASVLGGSQHLNAKYEEVEHEFGVARLTTETPLPAGKATLTLSYSAPFQTSGQGLYRTKAGDDWYAFTQFEAIDARRMFPGFDEPGFKTPFDITVHARGSARVIANTPVLRSTPEANGWVRHDFQTTRPLPTYLIAFAVGPLDVVDAGAVPPNGMRSAPLPLRLVAVHGQGSRTAFAVREAPKLVQRLEQYFGIAFPYPKLDLIASPIMGGAMENAGAIIFSERLLLFGEHPTAREQASFGVVTAHEMAHQWFGDLVTPAWWDDTWLNESFAEWMGVKVADAWRPDLGIKIDQLESTLAAMNTDALRAGRQIHQPIDNNDQISGAFDDITYEKGAGVLGMIESYLGEQRFQAGVRLHLKNHAYGTATAAEFFAAMAQGSGDPAVVEAFRSFVDLPGVPLLTVSASPDNHTLSLAQSRYRLLGAPGEDSTLWQMPVCVAVIAASARNKKCTMLATRSGTLTLATAAPAAVVHPNAQGEGYYRFAVDAAMFQKLLKIAPQLPPREALSFADSVGAAFDAGRLQFAELLAAAQVLATQPDRDAATLLGQKLLSVHDTLATAAERAPLERKIVEIYKPRLVKLGFDSAAGRYASEPSEQQLLRQSLLTLLVVNGRDPAVTNTLAAAAKRSLSQPASVDPLLRRVVWTAGVRALGKPFVDELEPLLLSTSDIHLRDDAIYAMSHADAPPASEQALALLLDKRLDIGLVARVIFDQMNNPLTRPAAWSWLQQNRDALFARLPSMFQGFFARIGQPLCSAGERAQFDNVLGQRLQHASGGELAVARVRESIDNCVALKQAVAPQLQAAFQAH